MTIGSILLIGLLSAVIAGYYVYLKTLKRKHKVSADLMLQRLTLLQNELEHLNQQLAECREELHHQKEREANDWEFMKEIIAVEERRRIALELHDDTVQRITIARLRLINAIHLDVDSPMKTQIGKATKELELIVNDLRYLIDNELQPDHKIHDLARLIKNLSDDYHMVWLNKQVVFRIFDTDKQFPIDQETTRELYYMVHETVVNAIKSSVAAEIKIRLEWKDGLKLTVKDNGQSRIIAKGGTGTRNIAARAEKIGAQLEHIDSPYGYTLIIRLARPVSDQTV